jgi:hypothetical protein
MVDEQMEVRPSRRMAGGRDHYFLDKKMNCWVGVSVEDKY